MRKVGRVYRSIEHRHSKIISSIFAERYCVINHISHNDKSVLLYVYEHGQEIFNIVVEHKTPLWETLKLVGKLGNNYCISSNNKLYRRKYV